MSIYEVLGKIAELMSGYYASSHPKLYPFRRLDIPVRTVPHFLRKKIWTDCDKRRLEDLYIELNDHGDDEDDPYAKYYIKLCKVRICQILNDE